jgi:hypothetical protein
VAAHGPRSTACHGLPRLATSFTLRMYTAAPPCGRSVVSLASACAASRYSTPPECSAASWSSCSQGVGGGVFNGFEVRVFVTQKPPVYKPTGRGAQAVHVTVTQRCVA